MYSSQFKEAILNILVKVAYQSECLQSKKALIFQQYLVGKSNSMSQVLVCQKSLRQINDQVKKSLLFYSKHPHYRKLS